MPTDPEPPEDADALIDSTDVLVSWDADDPAETLDVVLLDLDDE